MLGGHERSREVPTHPDWGRASQAAPSLEQLCSTEESNGYTHQGTPNPNLPGQGAGGAEEQAGAAQETGMWARGLEAYEAYAKVKVWRQ